MLCRNCTSEIPADVHFCVKCGATVDATPDPPLQGSSSAQSLLPAEANVASAAPPAEKPAPPYAAFVAQVLGLALCLSVLAFTTTFNLSHATWRVFPLSVIGFVLAIVLMLRLPGAWRRIEAGVDDSSHPRKVLRRSLLFVVLFVVTAALVGFGIGQTGKETGQLIADFQEMASIRDRIAEARNGAERTVPANIAMYKSIEQDVRSFDAVLLRLQAELPAYDERFPDQHEQTAKSIHTIDVGLKRADLLRQEIAVAIEIAPLDSKSQWQAWQERMDPLLAAEDELDKPK